MDGHSIETVACGSSQHLADVASLRASGLPVPHHYSQWPLHDPSQQWQWVRILRDGSLLSGFSIALGASHALPGTWIGRVERIGRRLHEEAIPAFGTLAGILASQLPRLQRLEVAVFDEDSGRRERLCDSLVAAGARPLATPRSYSHTLRLDLQHSDEAMLRALTTKTRRRFVSFRDSPVGWTEPISDPTWLPRIESIHRAAFDRTESSAPGVAFEDILADARNGEESILVGAFVKSRPSPESLIAFAWTRLHGDHAVYDVGGSERSPDLRGVSPGDAVLWHATRWARERGAAWLDLGGVIAADEPDTHPLYGISSFKRRISNDEVVVGSEFVFEPSPTLTALAAAARRAATLVGGIWKITGRR